VETPRQPVDGSPASACAEESTSRAPKKADVEIRVRYAETDQLGTFYNARALEWFECARTELLREIGTPYTMMEERSVFLPIVEAHVEYLARARYDDRLRLTATASMTGKASVRFEIFISHADGGFRVASGYTVHAVTDAAGKPIRAPEWFTSALL
jgi:acyl-CoA thioester hydrolase